jgi:hypothetical protein
MYSYQLKRHSLILDIIELSNNCKNIFIYFLFLRLFLVIRAIFDNNFWNKKK